MRQKLRACMCGESVPDQARARRQVLQWEPTTDAEGTPRRPSDQTWAEDEDRPGPNPVHLVKSYRFSSV